MEVKQPRRIGWWIAGINGLLILYVVAWVAGISELRRLTDWRGPLAALILAIALSAVILIQQIQALG